MSVSERRSVPIRVLIVDDHPALREGLGHRIDAQHDMEVCGQAADVNEALRNVSSTSPDVVVVDLALKNSDGLDLINLIQQRHRRVRTLVHSMYQESRYASRCLQSGARGYVNKEAHPDEVITAIREVGANRIYLSPDMADAMLDRVVGGDTLPDDPVEMLTNRQLAVFRLIGEGCSAVEIADRLHISVHTVESHRENIKKRLSVGGISELNRRAVLWVAQDH